MPNKITEGQIAEAYSKGKAVFDGELPLSDAINELALNGSMNKSSATDYIRNFFADDERDGISKNFKSARN